MPTMGCKIARLAQGGGGRVRSLGACGIGEDAGGAALMHRLHAQACGTIGHQYLASSAR